MADRGTAGRQSRACGTRWVEGWRGGWFFCFLLNRACGVGLYRFILLTLFLTKLTTIPRHTTALHRFSLQVKVFP